MKKTILKISNKCVGKSTFGTVTHIFVLLYSTVQYYWFYKNYIPREVCTSKILSVFNSINKPYT